MLTYNYHYETGEYLGSEELQPDPLEPGKWLIPANSTLIAPPEFDPKNQKIRFTGNVWERETIIEAEPADEEQETSQELTEIELKQRRIWQLKYELAVDDWKIIKCAEYLAVEIEPPYDISALHASREGIRAEINQLEQELNAKNSNNIDSVSNVANG